ncbi:RHS repeat-associated core domain-containing protein [Paenibacillus kobensis]|uniref:RHS repeat-associated core domain-containing protein n=1 Tax=Paenibacillus kobensis TaxID=59841 RepID=UPI000FDB41D0|nr:RHS repeat-associated core domain-containing protein [Paenibacillus kobensis]
MKNVVTKAFLYLIICSFLVAYVPVDDRTVSAEPSSEMNAPSQSVDAASEKKKSMWIEQFGVTNEEIQAELDEGYTLDDIEKALNRMKASGESLEVSLVKVKPHAVNRSQEAKSQVTSDVDADSFAAATPAMALMSAAVQSPIPDYNHVKTKPDEAPFTVQLDNETVSTLSGGLSLRAADLSLPGRNGLSFTLSRSYDSGSSQFDQMAVKWGENATEQPMEEKRFPIGKGWGWDLSFIEINETAKFLHLAGSGVFKIDENNALVGYPWIDLTFAPDTSVTVNSVVSAYVLKSIQHMNQYFNAEGQLIQISDAYNNKITFSYSNHAIYGSVLTNVSDAIGNSINIAYNQTSVVLTSGTRTVKYYKANYNGKELLSQVVDELGRATTYDYSIKNAKFSLLGTTADTDNPYALISGVTYPTGAKTVYAYEDTPTTRYISDNAVNQVYRVKSREEQFTLSDNSIQHVNHKDISYPTGDIGSSNNADITFTVRINDGAIDTTFTNFKDYIDATHSPVFYNTAIVSTATAEGKTYTNQTDYTYDRARKWPVPTNTKVTRSESGSTATSITTTSAMYDDYGNIISTTDPMGTMTRNTFDPTTHLLQTVAKPINGAQQWQYTQYTRNSLGAVIKEQLYAGTSSGPTGNPLRETNYENIDATTGNVGQIRYANGSSGDSTTLIEYSAAYKNAFPTKTSTVVHDIEGNASTIVREYTYASTMGQLQQYKDGQSGIQYGYDNAGRVTRVTHLADNSFMSIEYLDYLNQMVATDQTGVKSVTKWNPVGWKTDAGITEDGKYKAKAKYGYDAKGNVLWTEDATGNRTNYGYDQWSRQRSVTFPDLDTNSTVMNDIANTKTSTDSKGNVQKEYYDLLGRVLKVEETNPGKQPTILSSYTYDNAGNVLTVKDNAVQSNTTTYAYDVLSQLRSVSVMVNGAVQTTSYDYDALGNQTTITFPDNKTTIKKYDEAGRLIQNTVAAVSGKNNIESYYYDTNNNLIRMKDRNGNRFKYTYDSRSNLMFKDIVDASWNPIAGEERISFTYDLAGRRKSMTDQTGTTSYSYQPFTGALSTLEYPDGKKISYDYDVNGNRSSMNDPFGANTYYHYDSRNRLDAVGLSPDLVNDYDAKYQYEQAAQLRQVDLGNGVKSSYTYVGNKLDTLTEYKSNGALLNSYSYKYDGNRNITDITANNATNSYQYDEMNRIRTSTQYNETYTYDNRGNRSGLTTNRPFERPDGQTTFDKRDRLTSVVTASGSSVSYRYNGDGQLWERTENGQTTRYYWDGDQIIAEATVTGTTAAFKARYVRGRGLVAREDSQGKAYYVHNGHGDVTDLMDADGITRLNTYSYDVFGNIASMNETVAQPFKYSGEMQDTTTGLQYLRARWYDPSIGRFVNEDTYEGDITNPLTLNLYTYTANNPLIYSDPSGHCFTSWLGKKYCEAAWEGTKDAAKAAADAVVTGVKATVQAGKEFCTWFGCADVLIGLGGLGPEFGWMSSVVGVSSTVVKGTEMAYYSAEAFTAARTGYWALGIKPRGFGIEVALGGMGNAFPTIDKFVNGANGIAKSVTSIKSLDFTLKSYQKDGAIYNKVMEYVNDVVGFDDTTWGGIVVNVDNNTQRVLELALPPVKQSAAQAQQITIAINDAAAKGITVIIQIIE